MKMLKPIQWMGSSKNDLRDFPDEARRAIGVALFAAQTGGEDPATKALQGFGGRSVLEIVQKKSRRGSRTPQADIELIKSRLKAAEVPYRTQFLKRGKT
jgi:phage-related protein